MAVEILRPNANGSWNDLYQHPGTGSNYDKVDEVGAHDGNATYVYQEEESEGADKDLYQLQNSAVGAGIITSVTVKIVAAKFDVE
jgi:hypothetical protein